MAEIRGVAHRLGQLLLDVGRRRCLRDPITSTFEAMQFTPSQFHAMMWLGFDGPLTMGEVARRGGITEKTITGIVDRMERADLLQRERDAEDRRVVHVHLTRKGLATFHRLRAHMFGQLERMLSILDEEDRSDLLRIVTKIRDRVGELGAIAAGGRS